MARETTFAILLIVMTLALCLFAVSAKVHTLQIRHAFDKSVVDSINSLGTRSNENDRLDAQQYQVVRDLNNRVGELEERPAPQAEIKGDAYCLIAQGDGNTVVLACKPFS
jgi:uncharacterized coiled-coil protein SlyX